MSRSIILKTHCLENALAVICDWELFQWADGKVFEAFQNCRKTENDLGNDNMFTNGRLEIGVSDDESSLKAASIPTDMSEEAYNQHHKQGLIARKYWHCGTNGVRGKQAN